jgi:transcriptional repressor NrdR
MVIKSDQRREPFDIAKIRNGVVNSLKKRPVSVATIDDLVNQVEEDLTNEYIMEIPSKAIGEKVLEKLWDVDLVAYIRFASVYRKFADLDTFMEELNKLRHESLMRLKAKNKDL